MTFLDTISIGIPFRFKDKELPYYYWNENWLHYFECHTAVKEERLKKMYIEDREVVLLSFYDTKESDK